METGLPDGCRPGHPHPTCLSAGPLRALLFIFASVCAWYSGYLLAELIPDVPLSSAVYSIRSIGERPVLKGQCPGHSPLGAAARLQGGSGFWPFYVGDDDDRQEIASSVSFLSNPHSPHERLQVHSCC